VTLPRIAIGDFDVSLVRDSAYWMDGGAMFGVVPKTLWNAHCPSDEQNRIPLAFNCYLIRTEGHSILVETGPGDKLDGRTRERMRLPATGDSLPDVLARHGVDPESIDIVINSHLHWDHCSGNTILAGGRARPSLPRARYFTARGEWEHAHERLPRDSVSYIDANYDPLVESGRMTLIEGDCQIVPGVWMRRAPGHNRDVMAITAESHSRTFCFLSDVVPLAAHVKPTWVAAVDLYPLQAIETKTQWLQAAESAGWICGFAHETTLDFARIEPDPKNHFRAVQYND
jgi:glyoxylase-like metal-dependent hydrolase (beta-lactamase superfamily II)